MERRRHRTDEAPAGRGPAPRPGVSAALVLVTTLLGAWLITPMPAAASAADGESSPLTDSARRIVEPAPPRAAAPLQIWGEIDSDSLRACRAAVRGRPGVDVREGDAYDSCLSVDFLAGILRVWPWLQEQGVGDGRPLYLFFDDAACDSGLVGIASEQMHLNLEQVPYGVDDAIGSLLIVGGRAGARLDLHALAPPRHEDGARARIDLTESVGLLCVPTFETSTAYGPVTVAHQRATDGSAGDLDDTVTYIRTTGPRTGSLRVSPTPLRSERPPRR